MKTAFLSFCALSALASLTEARRACTPDIVHPGFGSYTIVGGDNLNDIAKDFGTTSTQLAAMNGIPDPDSIKPGNNLIVPCV
ncbi:Immunoglobulin G-binding protein A [Colletotrichum trifolii]|uniref:Immunoglobulin G-binding protein A n=1 Tax=Colletotrichum trifolii TaxID=5466 RepID=A0A4R8QQK9_COLTR|nr:Immunoglobulin G-binding protein A [Colletotrichum trifolii]